MNRRFRLQKVLEYRNIILEKEKVALAEMIKQEEQIKSDINKIELDINSNHIEAKNAVDAGQFNYIPLYQKYLATLEKQKIQSQIKLISQRKKVSEQKNKTVSAMKNKEIIDNLKEEHKIQYKDYVDYEERKMIEDIVLTRKASKINSGDE